MITEALHNDIVQSLMKFCLDIAEEANADGMAPGIQLWDWEAHAVEPELPAGDLVGPGVIGVELVDKEITVAFSIGISTESDEGLFRLRRLVSRLFARLQPGVQLTLYDHAAAAPRDSGWIQTTGPTNADPVTRSEQRVFATVSTRAKVDPKAV